MHVVRIIPEAQAATLLETLGGNNAPMATTADLGTLIINVLNFMFAIGGGVIAVMVFYGIFRLIIAGGDSNKAGEAKKIITAALVGGALIITAATLVRFYVELLGGKV